MDAGLLPPLPLPSPRIKSDHHQLLRATDDAAGARLDSINMAHSHSHHSPRSGSTPRLSSSAYSSLPASTGAPVGVGSGIGSSEGVEALQYGFARSPIQISLGRTVNPVGCPIHWATRNEGPFDGLGHSKGRDQKGIDVVPNRTGSDSDGFVGHLMAPRKHMARTGRGVFAIMTRR